MKQAVCIRRKKRKKKKKEIPPHPNTQRNSRRPGDRDRLETVCDERRLTRSPYSPASIDTGFGSMGTCTASLSPLLGPNGTINTISVRSSQPVIHGCASPDFARSSFAAGPVSFIFLNLLISPRIDHILDLAVCPNELAVPV